MPACAGPQAPGAAPETPATGLLLTGGGARAAYQVGVLEAIADLRRVCGAGRQANPLPIITRPAARARPRRPPAPPPPPPPRAGAPGRGPRPRPPPPPGGGAAPFPLGVMR